MLLLAVSAGRLIECHLKASLGSNSMRLSRSYWMQPAECAELLRTELLRLRAPRGAARALGKLPGAFPSRQKFTMLL
jgi:hypothetical protein